MLNLDLYFQTLIHIQSGALSLLEFGDAVCLVLENIRHQYLNEQLFAGLELDFDSNILDFDLALDWDFDGQMNEVFAETKMIK